MEIFERRTPGAWAWILVLMAGVLSAQEPAAPGAPNAAEKTLVLLRGVARAHFGAGRTEEAWKAYDAAVALAPGDPELLNEYAWNLVSFPGASKETARRALPHAETAARLAPRSAEILDTLAEVHFVLGDTGKALEWNAKCRALSPLSTFSEQLAKYAARFAKELDDAGAPAADRARALALLAEGLLGTPAQDFPKAAEAARAALALDASCPGAAGSLGRALLGLKKFAEAAKAFQAEFSRPGSWADPVLHRGFGLALLEGGGSAGQAILHFREALALAPELPGVRAPLARAFLESGDADAALATATLAMAKIQDRWQPEFAREPLLVLAGKAWEAKGRPEFAAPFFLQAVLQRGNDPEGEKGLDRAYRALYPQGPPAREFFAARNGVSTVFFDDATEEAGLSKASGRRVAWGDADGDGRPDLLLGGASLWRNRGKAFEEDTGFAKAAGGRGCGGLFADADNDGDLDVFVASHGKTPETGDALLLNDGKGAFSEKKGAGVTDREPTEGAAFGDFDGNVDLYVANYEEPMSVGHPDFLYRGRGDGTFADVTASSGGVEQVDPRCGRGVNCGDFDNDGDLDIHVSNYRLQPNFLFRNRGDGTFTNVAREAGVEGVPIRGCYGHTIGSDWADVDNDGDLDLFQANLAHPRFIEFSNQSFLLMNSGAPAFAFEDRRPSSGIRYEETHSDPVFADFDNDGFQDLYVTSVYEGRKSFLYRNRGDGTFEDVTWYAGVRADNGWGCAVADVDADGDLDLLVCAGPGPKLFRNRGNGNAWLTVRVAGGPASNRAGIGARIWVRTGDGLRQMREIKGGRGTTSQDEPVAHFGLGPAKGDVEVTVRFLARPPVTRTFRGVKPNQVLVVAEKE
jgi:tetratricopeptide (TPR) repeat protein